MAKQNKTFEEQYLHDLEEAFQKALKNQNFSTAIRAKELQARMIEKQREQKPSQGIRLTDLTPADIKNLIQDLESYPFTHSKYILAVKKHLVTMVKHTAS